MSDPNKLWAPRLFFWAGLLVAAGLFLFLLPRHHYYLMAPAQRPMQPEHDTLRSSGYYGLSFGAIGTFLIFLNLSYLVRKELVHWSWLGNLRSWMSFHVTTGIIALLLVLLHSGFLLRSAMGSLALVAFSIVILTGVIGRYVYAHTPRSLEGSELEIDEVRSRLKDYRTKLEKLGMPQGLFKTVVESSKTSHVDRSIVGSIYAMIVGDRELWHTYDELKRTLQKTPTLRPMAPQILPLAHHYYQELQWLSRFHELRGFMGTWRFFHRWLAILMLSAVLFHILVAQQMGNLWLFDKGRLHEFYKITQMVFQHFLHVIRYNIHHSPSLNSILSHIR
jgi:hypothetical protein